MDKTGLKIGHVVQIHVCRLAQIGTTRTATRTEKKNNGFNKQNNNFARASHFFAHFVPVFARLRRENV